MSALKRTAETLYNNGGIIRKLDNLGQLDTPYKISAHSQVHKHANYFIYKFDAPVNKIDELKEEYAHDVDLLRRRIYKITPPVQDACTLELELQPAPYRKEVQEMIAISKRNEKKPFNSKAGITYYPFQR